MASFLLFIQALPQFIVLLNRLSEAMIRLMTWAKDHELENWLTDLEVSIDQLEKAKSAEEKLNAAQSLVNSIRRLK